MQETQFSTKIGFARFVSNDSILLQKKYILFCAEYYLDAFGMFDRKKDGKGRQTHPLPAQNFTVRPPLTAITVCKIIQKFKT